VRVRDKPERDPEDDQDPEDKLNRIPATLVRRLTEILWHLRVPPPSSPGPSRGSGAHWPPSRNRQVTLGSQEPLLVTHEPVAR
ncbi:hypothetical protein DYB38_011196, partial [Aphanomyces astaci]